MRVTRVLSVSAVTAIAALALSGCVAFGGGPKVSEERDIDAVTTVVLDASGDITISEGEPSLVIHALQGAMDRLTSEVSGDTLTLGSKGGFLNWTFGEVRYDLTLPDLETLELNGSGDIESAISTDGTLVIHLDGSGDIELSGLDAERVEVEISGSGGVDLAGTATELQVILDGSGDVDAASLEVQEAVVEIGGSGDVSVAARDNLSVRISGSGQVEYTGNPVVDSEISGSGEVVRED
jgi:putative autotransporter adhesin-like protein